MAVANQTPYKEYTANGTTTIFPLEFDCDDAEHLIVKVNDVDIPALNNWSLSTITGSVVFNIAPINESKIILQRDTPLVRNTDYQTYNNSLRPQPVNNDFDKIWLKLQELGVTNWLTDTDIKNLNVYVNSLNEETRDDFFNQLGNLEQNTNAMLEEAIKNGAVSALAITTVNTVADLENLENIWDGRTVYVKDFANFKYSSANNAWLLSVDSAQSVALNNGKTVQDMSYEQIQGNLALRDSVVSGIIDTLSNTSSQTPAINLQNKKVVIPNGTLECTSGWLGNKGVGKFIDNYRNFELSGQGDSTKIKYKQNGGGGQLFLDYLKDFIISNLFLDNTPIGAGSPSNVKEGQLWIRYSKDGRLDNLRFAGGDILTCTIDSGTNILATNMRVDFQYRYQSGIAKSPLIFGGGSKQCMYIQGYVKGVSDNGTVLYNGDLGDNDQSLDSKWAFINMYGIPYATGGNSAACMWQEGEYELSNSHHFGMNYMYNGIGHGISELALGTDIGCVFRENQVRGVWSRNKYVSIGNHFLNITSPNIGGANPAIGAAIHVENGFTSSVGDFFEGNTTDLSQYNGSAGLSANTSIHCSNDRFSGLIKTSATGGTAAHLGLSNSAMTNSSTFNLESLYTHSVIENMFMTGRVGRFGATGYIAKFRIMASTCLSNGTTEPMLTLVAGSMDITDSFIKDYNSGLIVAGSNTSIVFRNCKFHNVTFLAADLTDAKYINCEFVNCTNAPNSVGLNFKCDSDLRPSSIRTEVTLAAGGSYTFPTWAHELRGVYDINVGGRGENTAVYKGYAHKASAASAATIVNTLESTVGAITVTWAANGYIKITVTTAGTYSIKLG